MIKKILFICIIYLISISPLMAKDTINYKQLFYEGNSFYQQGKFKEAIKSYEKIISYGLNNYVIYYNLGNASFKDNNLGKALLNYYRAIKVSPRDKEIRHNLAFAKTKLKDKIPKDETFLEKLIFYLNLNELTFLAGFLYFLTAILIILYINKRKEVILWLLIASSSLLIVFGSWFGYRLWDSSITKAVVTSSEVQVKSGPSDDYKLAFELHEGTKLNIVEENNHWYEVEVFGALRGWLKKETVEKL